MSKHILVIEDNKDIAHLVGLHVRDLGFEVTLVHEGPGGLQLVLSDTFDLIILDLMLPGMDGFEICRRLRQKSIVTPVLMLTAKSAELDRVLGLEIGADDYLTKPFSIRELLARVKALLRRVDQYSTNTTADNESPIVFGDLTLDPNKRKVLRQESEIELTAKEFDLLWHFASHPGRVYTRTQLLDYIWGYGHDGYEHTVNSHINRLRAKIEDNSAKPRYILTVWGVGYKFSDQETTIAE